MPAAHNSIYGSSNLSRFTIKSQTNKGAMTNTILAGIVFLTGISLSTVAAFYSIIGLTTIFAGAFWPIIIMGTVLEISKLVSVSWLHHNWKETPILVKSYMIVAILVLMLITSMGIFGFLSKAHIEQQLKLNTGVSTEIVKIDNLIKIKEDTIKDFDKQLSVIDNSINSMIEKGKAKDSLAASDKQKKTREDLVKRKNIEITELNELKNKKISLGSEHKKLEAEIGPLKYVAEFFYGDSSEKLVDNAVTYMILIIIFVFDPLAIFLLIAFNQNIKRDEYYMEYYEYKPRKKRRFRSRSSK